MVFPNPTSGQFQVRIDQPVNAELNVMDLTGRIVVTNKVEDNGTWQRSYDLSREPKGVYIVKVTSGGKVTASRLIIK